MRNHGSLMIKAVIVGTAVFSLRVPPVAGVKELVVQVHVLRGAWEEGRPGLKQETVWTTSSTPFLASIKSKAGGTEAVFTAALVEAIIDSLDLEILDDLFAFSKTWDGTSSELSDRILHALGAFEFDLKPRRIAPDTLELTAVVYKSKDRLLQTGETMEKDRAKMVRAAARKGELEKIFDGTIALSINDPVIVGIPSAGGALFLAFLVRSAEKKAGKNAPTIEAAPETSEIIAAPKPVRQVVPAYPEDLRRQGIRGEVELQVAVDEDGEVAGLKVTKSVHPYLDYAAVQALRQWRYVPTIRDGKRVPVVMTVVVTFDPETYPLQMESARKNDMRASEAASPAGEELRRVLAACGEYCRRLLGSALDFVCEETIKEVHFNFHLKEKWAGIAVATRGGGPVSFISFPTRDPARTEKNSYVSDYMFVKKEERTEERRVLLKENGRKRLDRTKLLEEKRFTILVPMFAPARLLVEDRRRLFYYRILDEDRVKGRKAYVLEATPKSGSENGVEYAKIWVDRATSQILRSEISGVPLEGFDDVLIESTAFLIKPVFTTTYVYDVEQKGVLFPSRLEIRVLYPTSDSAFMPKTVKWKADLSYDHYRFFTVETDSKILK